MSDAGATFRSASAPAAPTTSAPGVAPTHVSDSHEASLFATYEADQKKPYVADYFAVPEVWNKEPSLKRDLQEIEGYIREQVSNKKVDNTVKAAQQFLKELERKADLTRYESSNTRITKLLAYIDFRRVVES